VLLPFQQIAVAALLLPHDLSLRGETGIEDSTPIHHRLVLQNLLQLHKERFFELVSHIVDRPSSTRRADP
jgi:hypothetical protein